MAGGLIGVGLISIVAKTADIPANLVITANPSLEGGNAVIKYSIKNPIGQSVRIVDPFVKISYGSTVLASSSPSGNILTIPANGMATGVIKLGFDILSALASVPSLVTTILSGGSAALTLTTISGIVTGIGTTTVDKTQTWNAKL